MRPAYLRHDAASTAGDRAVDGPVDQRPARAQLPQVPGGARYVMGWRGRGVARKGEARLFELGTYVFSVGYCSTYSAW